MQIQRRYKDETSAEEKLRQMGLDLEKLQQLSVKVAYARDTPTVFHPKSASGTYGYHEGVFHLRQNFVGINGWLPYSKGGIEGIENEELGLIVLYQNVDQACCPVDPSPLSSGKGRRSAIKTLVQSQTFDFWPDELKAELEKKYDSSKIWFMCVSVRDGRVSAEFSRPYYLDENGSFGPFAVRIDILQSYSVDDIDQETLGDFSSGIDFDVDITKKE
ncbi:MAG: hypothetical protein P1V33_13665 [Pseudohongiella nitratireducens]|nr:hypothetical protein [Pseudohongiella nitratireducens]MDF1624500.1 hypothetical protein [Pseudohongiella nitratireducens]